MPVALVLLYLPPLASTSLLTAPTGAKTTVELLFPPTFSSKIYLSIIQISI